MNELVVALKEADIDIISQEVFIQDPFERLKNIKVNLSDLNSDSVTGKI